MGKGSNQKESSVVLIVQSGKVAVVVEPGTKSYLNYVICAIIIFLGAWVLLSYLDVDWVPALPRVSLLTTMLPIYWPKVYQLGHDEALTTTAQIGETTTDKTTEANAVAENLISLTYSVGNPNVVSCNCTDRKCPFYPSCTVHRDDGLNQKFHVSDIDGNVKIVRIIFAGQGLKNATQMIQINVTEGDPTSIVIRAARGFEVFKVSAWIAKFFYYDVLVSESMEPY